MSEPWLDIVGIGEDGMAGLTPAAQACVETAEIIIGGDRHHGLSASVTAERIAWPSPFDAMIDTIRSYCGRRIVILVTGDPLWYSVGARITKAIPAEEIRFHPQLSAFQWAACRMGWSLADSDTLTVHGRPVSQIVPHIAPGNRMLVLTQDAASPSACAALLTDRGFEDSRMTVLGALGGSNEMRIDGTAGSWTATAPDFHTLAIECVAGPDARWYPRSGGLPDEAFEHDGQMTKQDIRAATIAKLAPFPDALLWDIGAGCGSVAVEWMRGARAARAVGIERKAARCSMMERNARELGVEKFQIVEGEAPSALAGLEWPDAVFIGGGLTDEDVFETAWDALKPGGRLVANTVTLESEARLIALHAEHGGSLVRHSVQHAEAVGPYRGWRAAMPVVQWSVTKPVDAGR